MAAVALVDVHYGAARSHFGAIHREVGDLVDGAVFAGHLLRRTGQQRAPPAPFDADGIRAGGCRGNGVSKRIGAGAAAVALGGGNRVLRHIAWRGYVGTELRIAIVRGRTSHYQSQAVAAAGQLRHRDRVAGVVFRGKGDGGSLAGDAVVHLNEGEHDASVGERLGGNRVRANDGSVELQLALRNMTLRALAVVDLRQVDVVLAGGEVHVVEGKSPVEG